MPVTEQLVDCHIVD